MSVEWDDENFIQDMVNIKQDLDKLQADWEALGETYEAGLEYARKRPEVMSALLDALYVNPRS